MLSRMARRAGRDRWVVPSSRPGRWEVSRWNRARRGKEKREGAPSGAEAGDGAATSAELGRALLAPKTGSALDPGDGDDLGTG